MVSYRQGGMYMSCRVLLAEDDRALGETIVDYLTAKSGGEMELIWVQDGAGACSILNKLRFQLVLLDIMLPGMDGFTLCRELRKRSNAPVMFLTARGLEEDKLRGYELGCDDYLVKPFSLAELYVRARALLRRSGEGQDPPPLTAGKIQLSAQTGQVTLAGVPLELTRREFQLLRYLLEHKNQLVSRDALLDGVWGYDFTGGDRVVDNHIGKLRRLLGPEAARIKTVIGMGYRLEG